MKKIYYILKNILYIIKNIYFIYTVAKKYVTFFKYIPIIIKFLKNHFLFLFKLNLKYRDNKNYFKNLINRFRFSNDWFTNNIPNWLYVFEKIESNKINYILEIGSYEGMSSKFLLNYFDNAQIDCVETFTGSDEHSNIDFLKVESNFKFNLNNHQERYRLFKMNSKNFFNNKLFRKQFYDLIYIDGSHYKDDVYDDAVNSFEILNKNGIIIFDDFLRKYYVDSDKNVIGAVFKFIEKYSNKIEIIFIGYQIFIKKIN